MALKLRKEKEKKFTIFQTLALSRQRYTNQVCRYKLEATHSQSGARSNVDKVNKNKN
jgi:hypothetical protein